MAATQRLLATRCMLAVTPSRGACIADFSNLHGFYGVVGGVLATRWNIVSASRGRKYSNALASMDSGSRSGTLFAGGVTRMVLEFPLSFPRLSSGPPGGAAMIPPVAIRCSSALSSGGGSVSSGVSNNPCLRVHTPALVRLVSIVSGTDSNNPMRMGDIHQMYRGAMARMTTPQAIPMSTCHL